MACTEELSDIQHDTFIGCHLTNKSVRQMNALLEIPWSNVSAVIVKWKRLGAKQLSRKVVVHTSLQNMTNLVLKCIARKNHLSSVATLITEFQTPSGSNVSKISVCRELKKMGFHDRAVAHKP